MMPLYRFIPVAILAAMLIHACGKATEPQTGGQAARTSSAGAVAPATAVTPTLPADFTATPGMVLSWVQHSKGKFEPCGCVAGMFGGLLRRATLLGQVDDDRLLILEGGGWTAGSRDFQVIKTRHYLSALKQQGAVAVALGAAEVELEPAVLQELLEHARDIDLPVLACNLEVPFAADLFRQSLVVNRAGQEWLLTAVVPNRLHDGDYQIADPVAALQQVLVEAGDLPVICAADLAETELHDLARALPSLHAIIGGAVDNPAQEVMMEGQVALVYTANHGKTLGWWHEGGQRVHYDLIADTIPEHPSVRQAIKVYQEALGGADLAIDSGPEGLMTIGSGPRVDYIGSDQCMVCHQDAAKSHQQSRHIHAYETLLKKGYHRDPECLQCHVTGLGKESGYRRNDAPGYLRQVSCESCHGPGSVHVRNGGQTPMRPVSAATCVTCHDAENSPHFDYATYWLRIRHK